MLKKKVRHMYIKILFSISLLLFSNSLFSQNFPDKNLRIWYDKPAKASINDIKKGIDNDAEWIKALPVGNGFLGAMVLGAVNQERIQLNEKSLWSGSPADNNNPEAAKYLGEIRKLLFNKKYKEANELAERTQVCKGVGSAKGSGAEAPYGSYQTLGNLLLDFGKNSAYNNYIRELDLNRGVVRISYNQDGINYQREIFASYPDRVLVLHFTADKKGAINFSAMLNRPERFATIYDNNNLMMYGTLSNGNNGDGMQYAARLKAINSGGRVIYSDSMITVKNANEVTLLLTASTNYKQDYPNYTGGDPKVTSLRQMNKAASKSYTVLFKNHVNDFSSLFDRVSLNLTTDKQDTIPTDERLMNQLKNADDPYLHELYFQYGRYLLISSSRKGSLPANLQGIWSNKIQAPWNCDYHADINLQMNYWPVDETNLGDCFEPFENLIKSLVKPGEVTAKVQYNASGWCTETITNVWGYTSPGEGIGWGLYVAGGGWLCRHLWDHYLFTMDYKYLKSIYPVILGAAQFYLDWLVKDPSTGKLVSGPSTSPENSFIAPDGSINFISMGPSNDQEIIHELFTNVIKASRILKDKNPLLTKIANALQNLVTPRIGSDGRLMEWSEEFKETQITHRHLSHLYMLYPGDQIDPEKTPELAKAARKSLEVRGDGGTGWSLAWKINLWARLRDGNRAYKLLKDLLHPTEDTRLGNTGGGTYPNLFDACPPFQIDGNFGGTAGIVEMLMQSTEHEINLLPALPDAWQTGSVKGICARGGFVVSMNWKNGELKSVEIHSKAGNECRIHYKNQTVKFETKTGNTYKLDSQLELIK